MRINKPHSSILGIKGFSVLGVFCFVLKVLLKICSLLFVWLQNLSNPTTLKSTHNLAASLLKRPASELHFLFYTELNISTSTFVRTWNVGNVSFSIEWKTFKNTWAECQQAGEMAQDPRCQGSLPMPTYVLRWQKSTSVFNGLNTFLQNISVLFN